MCGRFYVPEKDIDDFADSINQILVLHSKTLLVLHSKTLNEKYRIAYLINEKR